LLPYSKGMTALVNAIVDQIIQKWNYGICYFFLFWKSFYIFIAKTESNFLTVLNAFNAK
jgi:sterol desaturase/sphingolipid hydroxylase (fatty acid hydroxylase superfamily)